MTLGHYRITGLLGKGGMGEVYRAVDARLNRELALKVLPEQLAQDPERRERFTREAQAIARLKHPNIVTIHSVEDIDGRLFLTMEYVEGKTLASTIPSDGLDMARFCSYAIDLADAVSTAHGEGITHRDLKPANIMFDKAGRLKVLDFGLAKMLADTTTPLDDTTAPRIGNTEAGQIVGTAAYMSPEQAKGIPVDHRSDIFSLGIVLYEMATGQKPFRGDSQMSTISAVIREDPESVIQLRATLPRDLGRIIQKCLRKEVDRRYQSAADLRNDLQELQEDVTSGRIDAAGGAAAAAAVNRPWLKPALAVAILTLMALGVLQFFRPGLQDHGSSALKTVRPSLVTSTGDVSAASLSPDGRYIAYAAHRDGHHRLHIKQLATGSDVQILPPTEDVIRSLAISSDGQHLYFERGAPGAAGFSSHDIHRIPILGGTPHRVVEDVRGNFALSPDGEKLAYYRQEGAGLSVMVSADDGSEEHRVTTLDDWEAFRNGLAWSPDGDRLLITEAIMDPGYTWQLVEVDASDGRVIRTSTSRWTAIRGIAWIRDGRIVVAGLSGRQRYQDNISFWQLSAVQQEPQLLFGEVGEYFGVSSDQSGMALASVVMTSDQSVWVVSANDSAPARKINYTSQVGNWFVQLAWADFGILVEHREGEELHIRCLAADGTTSRLLTTEGPFNMGAAVSPREDTLAYFSNRSGSMQIYLTDSSGANVRRLTNEDFEEFFPAFGGAGDWVYYHAYDPAGTRWTLRKAPVSGGPSVFIARDLGFPQVSPDGDRLLVSALDPACDPCVAILSVDGGEPEFLDLQKVNWRPKWHPNGKEVVSLHFEDEQGTVWVAPLDGSAPRKLASFRDEAIHAIAWNPDGDSLAVVTRRQSRDVVLLRNSSAQH